MFPTDFKSIQSRVFRIDPNSYSKTRNYLDGSVTLLSPYLTHGVISTKDVARTVLSRYSKQESFTFIFELAWREYWHKVWMSLKNIDQDISNPQEPVINTKMILSILNASTGIFEIDKAINNLYAEGYIHNHARMWIASLCCNIAKSNWRIPSKWMYYHLLDGDIASNTLSWQWVAGTFSSKKYYLNQENINKYSRTNQHNTFIDISYEDIKKINVPTELQNVVKDFELKTELPVSDNFELDPSLPTLLYSMWSLNPKWKSDREYQRVLVLEPSHFERYPISKKRVEFILNLSKNIDSIKLFVGEIHQLKNLNKCKSITSIHYPLTEHWPGKKENREFIFEDVNGNFESFSSFWDEAQESYQKM